MNGIELVDRRARVEARRPPPRRVEVVLAIDGTLDLSAALRVAATARARAAQGDRVRIDLRHARVHDVALAALAREAAGAGRVSLAGLSRHHERLLRYLAQDGRAGEPAGAGG